MFSCAQSQLSLSMSMSGEELKAHNQQRYLEGWDVRPSWFPTHIFLNFVLFIWHTPPPPSYHPHPHALSYNLSVLVCCHPTGFWNPTVWPCSQDSWVCWQDCYFIHYNLCVWFYCHVVALSDDPAIFEIPPCEPLALWYRSLGMFASIWSYFR